MNKELSSPVQEDWILDGCKLVRTVRAGRWEGRSYLVGQEPSSLPASPDEFRALWDQWTLRGAKVMCSELMHRIRVADFFCGCGGLAFGIRQAAEAVGASTGIELAADTDRAALQIYARNLKPTSVALTNLWEALDFQIAGRGPRAEFIGRPAILNDQIEAAAGHVDLLIGGPPCQGHSSANNRTRRDDPRNILYLAMPAAAVALGARAVLIENVMGITHDKDQVVETAKTLLWNEGYNVTEGLISGVRVGLPQTRKRHILLAAKGEVPDLSAVVSGLSTEVRSVRWAVEDLLGSSGLNTFDSPAELSPINVERIRHLFENGEFNMPDHIRPPSHQNGHTYPSVYGRLRWEEPAGTITAGFFTPGRGRYIHPSEPRALTAHEAARIQSFPDSFRFLLENGDVPSRKLLAKVIGDAVPPKLGYVVGLAAMAALASDGESSLTGACGDSFSNGVGKPVRSPIRRLAPRQT